MSMDKILAIVTNDEINSFDAIDLIEIIASRSQNVAPKLEAKRLQQLKETYADYLAQDVNTKKIIIQYPPDFDGELHIECRESRYLKATIYYYSFGHGAKGDDSWATLVEAAKAILAQEYRLQRRKQPC
jgi:hypothetical protein